LTCLRPFRFERTPRRRRGSGHRYSTARSHQSAASDPSCNRIFMAVDGPNSLLVAPTQPSSSARCGRRTVGAGSRLDPHPGEPIVARAARLWGAEAPEVTATSSSRNRTMMRCVDQVADLMGQADLVSVGLRLELRGPEVRDPSFGADISQERRDHLGVPPGHDDVMAGLGRLEDPAPGRPPRNPGAGLIRPARTA
jgi:hypothetical protein